MDSQSGGYGTRSPILDGSNYRTWKVKMRVYITSIDERARCMVLHKRTPPQLVDADGDLRPQDEMLRHACYGLGYFVNKCANTLASNSFSATLSDNESEDEFVLKTDDHSFLAAMKIDFVDAASQNDSGNFVNTEPVDTYEKLLNEWQEHKKKIDVFTKISSFHLDLKFHRIVVKNFFLNGNLSEDVYVTQPHGFEDLCKPDHVFKFKEALNAFCWLRSGARAREGGPGDVVWIWSPENPMKTITKRILGVEGDTVAFLAVPSRSNLSTSLVVPKSHVWIEGDNTYSSNNSRQLGPIPYSLVLGKVWPPQDFGRLGQ
ncbi:mitochondrial inner membrane protease subunit 1 [Phtheirospermum japonicum]|uniref:Mitochondrial inner membrane protease subunit 1 n=1 Tax=Phtheirospermum japonicum TaxID=374723 RepID=A0A830BHH9_9LAMI|nr:mitochondrial inner membrane protease subunit 1 [Phtheirospermum japonicum]